MYVRLERITVWVWIATSTVLKFPLIRDDYMGLRKWKVSFKPCAESWFEGKKKIKLLELQNLAVKSDFRKGPGWIMPSWIRFSLFHCTFTAACWRIWNPCWLPSFYMRLQDRSFCRYLASRTRETFERLKNRES